MWAAQRQLHHGKPTCVAGGCVSGALCTSHRQLRPRVTSPWPTVAYWLYNCGAQPVSLVRFWVCGVLRNSRNTPQGSVSVTSKYLYNMYFLHLLNKCVSPPPPISVMKHAEKRVYSESYLKNTSWGGGLKRLGLEAAGSHRIHTREAQTSARCCSASLSPFVLSRIPAREWCYPEWTSLSIHLYKHSQDNTPPRHAQRPVSFPPHWGHHSTQPKYIVTIGVPNKLIFPSS